ncbi:hypothetical protein TMatcc_000294 [Talaromyces marneffei ATCC 18224]
MGDRLRRAAVLLFSSRKKEGDLRGRRTVPFLEDVRSGMSTKVCALGVRTSETSATALKPPSLGSGVVPRPLFVFLSQPLVVLLDFSQLV